MENQAEKQSPRQKKKVITKIVCVVIAVLLMIGIAFIVANYVHKNNALPASSEVKNGLSAYELAAQQGYNGSLEDWLKSLDGKSAYEIAVDNGYTGAEDEWNKAIANVSNQNNETIKNAEFSKDGDLIITLSDGTTINVGKIAGSDGKNGTDGANGVDGQDGQDGKGISSASVNENGQLILTFSDGSIVNLDKIVGTNGVDGEKGDKGDKGDTGEKGADGKNGVDGKDGFNGADGKDGVGISTIVVTDDGNLNITLSNGTTLNLGTIKGTDGKDGRNGIDGAKGEKGTDGQNGQDGIGISNVNINADGELVLTFSDNQTINLGRIVGKDGVNGTDGTDGLNGTNGLDGKDGQDGIGIDNVTVSDDGALTVTLTNGTVLNLGNIKGADGIGISKSEINEDGELVLTYTNGDIKNLGKVTGRDGIDGTDGTGIKSVTLSTDGELIITLTDNSVLNLGNVKGEKGDKGDKGDTGNKGDTGADGKDGKDGRGIAKTEINDNGELVITYTDGTSDALQIDVNQNTSESSEKYFAYSKEDAQLSYNGATYTGYAIALDHQYVNDVTSIVIPSEHNGLPVVKIGFKLYGNDISSSTDKYNMIFGCQSETLKSVTIPESVRQIRYKAFVPWMPSSNLEEAIFEQPSGWRYYSASGVYKGIVPKATLEDPKAAAEFLKQGYQLERVG